MLPVIKMNFDTDNFTTFVKKLLNLEEKEELTYNRFDSVVIFKCNGDMESVRKSVSEWLERTNNIVVMNAAQSTGSIKEPEKPNLDELKTRLGKGKKEEV